MNILTCSNLIAMGRHIPTPFNLEVMDDQAKVMLKIESILRIIPGKRIVARTSWKNQPVVLKLFFRRGHMKQSMLRDLRGVTLLRQAGIPTPKVINQTTTADQQGAVLLIDFLPQATSLLSLFEAANSAAEKLSIMEMGVGSIARCHDAGLWQRDIHLDNFMLSHGKVFVLDGGDIKGDGKALDENTCLQNLAVFFAQFPVTMDLLVPSLRKHYQKSINRQDAAVVVADTLNQDLQNRIIAARQRRVRAFERKVFRSTTAFRQVHTSNRFAVYDRSIHSDAVESFIKDPDSMLAKAKMLKEGNSSTVAMIQFGGRDFVLKRYNVKGFLHGLKRLLQRSRADNSWRNAAMLEMLGIATPHAYLMLEERLLWVFRRRAWYLSEYIHAQDLQMQAQQDVELKLPVAAIVARFKELFLLLKTYHISHGDMKASNFILQKERLFVLDLDAMHHHQSAGMAEPYLRKDRERFGRNWDGTPFQSAVQQMLGELG